MMKAWKKTVRFALMLSVAALVYGQKTKRAPVDNSLAAKTSRFAPTVLTANTSRLSPNDRKALLKIVAAAKYYDPLFLRQIWRGNEALLQKLRADKTRLERQLGSSNSLATLAREARALGYVRPHEHLFVVRGIDQWRKLERASMMAHRGR